MTIGASKKESAKRREGKIEIGDSSLQQPPH